MKYLSIVILLSISFVANADKNKKSKEPEQLKQPAPEQEQQLSFTDTVSYDYGVRHYDARMGRYGYVEPDSADIVKYGITRPTMPEKKKDK